MIAAQGPNGRLVVEFAHRTPPGQPRNTRKAAIPLDIIDQRQRSATHLPARLVLGESPEFSVPPGSYLVRSILPSGEFMLGQAEVLPDRESRVYLRLAHPFPRETLDWAFLLKQIPPG